MIAADARGYIPHTARMCERCRAARKHAADHARGLVRRAILAGILRRPALYLCTYCDNVAVIYDHRNYNVPLEVDPVCRPCNHKLGQASWQPISAAPPRNTLIEQSKSWKVAQDI